TVGIAGSVVTNVIDNTIDAHITNDTSVAPSTTVTANGSLTVSTNDTSTIGAGAGVLGVGKGTFGFGASVVTSTITNDNKAYIEGATASSTTDGVQVSASSTPSITVIAVGLAGAESYALGGSVVTNVISDATDAHVSKSSNVTGHTNVVIS